jgi:hypothetical protein
MARRRKKGATLSWQSTKRAYTRYRKWDAKRRKENNKLARDRQAASKTIAAEKAAAAREKDQKAKARADAKAKRIKDAEAREKALGAARTRVVRAQLSTPVREAPASRRPATAPASSSRTVAVARPAGVCGAKTEDGTPCQRLGECGIHRPKNRPAVLPSTPAEPTTSRTHDGLGRPLTESGRRFFAYREAGYTGPLDQDARPTRGRLGG